MYALIPTRAGEFSGWVLGGRVQLQEHLDSSYRTLCLASLAEFPRAPEPHYALLSVELGTHLVVLQWGLLGLSCYPGDGGAVGEPPHFLSWGPGSRRPKAPECPLPFLLCRSAGPP